MTPSTEWAGWYEGEPKCAGRYLIIDSTYWHDRCATWVPGVKGRWYPDGAPYCDASGVAFFRPLPALPKREAPAMREVNNHSEV